MYKIIFSLSLLLIALNSFSQIAGIVSTKINAITVMPLPLGTAEMEPNYNYSRSNQYWDENGDLKNTFLSNDSIAIDANMSLRVAYPFTSKFEVGCNIDSELSAWSAKYAIDTTGQLKLGIMTGIGIPFGARVIDTRQRTAEQVSSYGYGAILSYDINERASIDFNFQVQDYIHDNDEVSNQDYFAYLDYGHYFGSTVYVASLAYETSSFGGYSVNKLFFSPGVAFESNEEYVLAINANFDLKGKNIEKQNGFNVAFTLAL